MMRSFPKEWTSRKRGRRPVLRRLRFRLVHLLYKAPLLTAATTTAARTAAPKINTHLGHQRPLINAARSRFGRRAVEYVGKAVGSSSAAKAAWWSAAGTAAIAAVATAIAAVAAAIALVTPSLRKLLAPLFPLLAPLFPLFGPLLQEGHLLFRSHLQEIDHICIPLAIEFFAHEFSH